MCKVAFTTNVVDHMVIITKEVCISNVIELAGLGITMSFLHFLSFQTFLYSLVISDALSTTQRSLVL